MKSVKKIQEQAKKSRSRTSIHLFEETKVRLIEYKKLLWKKNVFSKQNSRLRPWQNWSRYIWRFVRSKIYKITILIKVFGISACQLNKKSQTLVNRRVIENNNMVNSNLDVRIQSCSFPQNEVDCQVMSILKKLSPLLANRESNCNVQAEIRGI